MKGNKVPLPENAPQIGEQYRHYKGDIYKIFELAHHSNDEEWMVVYSPEYANPDAHLFTRTLREWNEKVEWPLGSGEMHSRFTRL